MGPHPQGLFCTVDFLKLIFIDLKMTDISSLAVAVIASNSWVTYVTITLFKIIPLKIIEDSCSHSCHVTDCLITYLHGRNYYKIYNMYRLLICMLYMDICCYKRYL